jgi:23S rRNA (cytosine1962-C5)-methyltransferase
MQDIPGPAGLGETVKILTASGEFLAWGAFSPQSKIRVRIWSWQPDVEINRGFFEQRLQQAISLREDLQLAKTTNAFRLVHAESDGLPGLIVDKYGDLLVVQFLSSGSEYWRKVLIQLLVEKLQPRCIYERSDADVRHLEGLPVRCGLLYGSDTGNLQSIDENGISLLVDFRNGHKTGLYLDQRANRKRLRSYVSHKDVLDCFSYTGGFMLHALAAEANSVLGIDSSAEAIALAGQNLQKNDLPAEKADWIEGDVFQVLRSLRDQDRSFDAIVLDPPKFAPTALQADRAARGYKDINLLAFKLLKPGGYLFTFSCSGGISLDLFQKIVASAALDAQTDAQILEVLHQDMDHPVALNFPEGEYLKGLITRRY